MNHYKSFKLLQPLLLGLTFDQLRLRKSLQYVIIKTPQKRPIQTTQNHTLQGLQRSIAVRQYPIPTVLWHRFACAKGVRACAPHCPNVHQVGKRVHS